MRGLAPSRVLAVAGLLAVGLGIQLYFFAHFPQPVLFGDPAGYYKVGEQLQQAVVRLRMGEAHGPVFESVRGYLPLLGVGSLFAVMDWIRPQDWAFFRLVLAAFNTLGMLGTFFLGRGLSGSFAGGLLGLAAAAIYPSYALQTGRLYPDPVTGCLFVWAAVLYLRGLHQDRLRLLAAAGFVFGLGLSVRAQIINYLLLVVFMSLAITAGRWVRQARARRAVLVFLLGWSPWVVAWGGVVWAVGDRDEVVQLGNFTFKQLYPYGFWQFLETDGWIGTYRLKQEPYYKAMEAEAAANRDKDLLRSRWRQVVFTARYVANRPLESALLVLDNAYRLYDRPANDYKWDYPFSYPGQVVLQRGIVLLALLGLVLFGGERFAQLGVFLLPLSLAALHGLVFPWPRYNLPVMPILIGAAGAAGVRLTQTLRAAIRDGTWRRPLFALALGGLLRGLAVLGFLAWPEASRVLDGLGLLALLASPFLLCAAEPGIPRPRARLAGVAWAGLVLLLAAHLGRSRLWHQVQTEVGGAVSGVEQEIMLTPAAMEAVRQASEAFLLFDLRVPRGDLSNTTLVLGETTLPGTRLLPTMPRLPESTSTGGRDWRGYPQWWALPLSPELLVLEPDRPLRVRLVHRGASPLVLGGDRFAHQEAWYEGPSFGESTKVVALKLEYDGDYRIPDRKALGSQGTRSFLLASNGARKPWSAVHRIRIVTLDGSQGGLGWEMERVPKGNGVVVGFGAFSGVRGRAELRVGEAVLGFPLGARQDFEVTSGGFRLCHRAQGLRGDKVYGQYLLSGPFAAGEPVPLRVVFKTGMKLERKHFVLDRRPDPRPLADALTGCSLPPDSKLVSGVARLLEEGRNNYPEDFGPWSISRVY